MVQSSILGLNRGKMLQHYAVLSDFAEFVGVDHKIHQTEFVTDESEVEAGEPIQELVLQWERRELQSSIILTILKRGEIFETIDVGPVADIKIRACVGYTNDEKALLQRFKEEQESNARFIGDSRTGFLTLETMESDDDWKYVILELAIPGKWLGKHHIETLSFCLANFDLLCKEISFSCYYLEEWGAEEHPTFHRFVHQAMEKVDRVFLLGDLVYRESDLEVINWSDPGVNYEDPSSYPEGFQVSEFTNTAIWNNESRLDLSALRSQIWKEVAQLLNTHAQAYSTDHDSTWILNHNLVKVSDIFMSINSNLTLGSAAPRRIRVGALPL